MKNKKLKEVRYSRKDLDKDFPTEESCLDYIFKFKNPTHICPICYKHKSFYRVSTRKCYSCSFCGHQIHPTAGTIFHKSSTLLRDWFYAIYLFSVSKNGVSAAELQRQLGVTYKTAWRMATSIRKLMDGDDTPFSGTVEIDEAFIGGKAKNVHTNSIESFWSLIKRSFDGTYHVVSEKYLDLYLSEFSFRYNHRFAPQSMFYSILNQL